MPLIQTTLVSAAILVVACGRISSAFYDGHQALDDVYDDAVDDSSDDDYNYHPPPPRRPIHIPRPAFTYRHPHVGGNWIAGHFYRTPPVVPPPPPRFPSYVHTSGLGGYGTFGVGKGGYGGAWRNGHRLTLPSSGRIPGDVTFGGRIPGLSGLGRYGTYGTNIAQRILGRSRSKWISNKPKATRRPGKKPKGRPGKKSKGRPGKKPRRRPGKKPKGRPGKKSKRPPGKKSTRRPGKKLTRRPGKKRKGRPGKKPTRRPGKKSTRRPGKKTTRRPGKKLTRRNGKKGLIKQKPRLPQSSSTSDSSGMVQNGMVNIHGKTYSTFKLSKYKKPRRNGKGRTGARKSWRGKGKKAKGRRGSMKPKASPGGRTSAGPPKKNQGHKGKKPTAKPSGAGTSGSEGVKVPRTGPQATNNNVKNIPGLTSRQKIPGVSAAKNIKYGNTGNVVLKPQQKPSGVPPRTSKTSRVPPAPKTAKKPAGVPKATSKISGIATDQETEEGDEADDDAQDEDDSATGNAATQNRQFRWAEMDDDMEDDDEAPRAATQITNAGSGAHGAYAVGQGGMGGVNINTATNGINAYNGGKIIMMPKDDD